MKLAEDVTAPAYFSLPNGIALAVFADLPGDASFGLKYYCIPAGTVPIVCVTVKLPASSSVYVTYAMFHPF